jgi:carbonic anhydrase
MMIKVFVALLLITQLAAVEPGQALAQLVEGNKRFQSNKPINPNQDAARREATLATQRPFAVIVACADSRVPPEILFDQGIGDLFVVRVAGNVVGPLEMESIEYATKVLGCSCLIVMGHERCGAVHAVVEGTTTDIRFISQLIHPAVIKARAHHKHDVLESAIRYNAQNVRDFCLESSIISELVSQKKLTIQAAYYNFDTGFVEMI